MKKKIIFILTLAVVMWGESCDESFLGVKPQAAIAPVQLQNLDGIEASLIGAYTMLNGNRSGQWSTYAGAPDLWIWGDCAADNAHKGSDPGDQNDLFAIEAHNPVTTNSSLTEIWERRFEGILRCNSTLRILASTPEVNGTQRGIEIEAEARFLRAHYYFDLWKIFKYVPYVTEISEDPSLVPNDHDILIDIEADMLWAEQNLPEQKPKGQVGRAYKLAAKAYLGKIYLYEEKYALALPLFKEVINSKPDLTTLDFRDNFDVTKKNGTESIFAVQASVNDASNGSRGNVGDMLNAPLAAGLPVSCCGFFCPSFDLANAFRVDPNGLPRFGNIHDDYFPSSFDPVFEVPVNLAVDPRLDYTLGRQGVPYRDWGPMAGNAWVRNPGYDGPFLPYKTVTDAASIALHTQAGASNLSDLNINIIRLADVYLMAAECAAQTTDLDYALMMVNKVRERAAKLPHKMITVNNVQIEAANYMVNQYSSFPDLNYAMKAIQWERRLELALEGYRFFDLRRWGILKTTLDAYSAYESEKLDYVVTIPKEDFFYPVPQREIDNSRGILTQHN